MPHDFIHRLVFEIDLDSNEGKAKAESDMLFEQHILLALDRVLARYSHVEASFPDTLEINLGSVAKADLGDKFESALTRLIEQHINAPRYVNTSYPDKEGTRSTTQTFIDYLHRPLIPWDIENVASFDRATLVQRAIEEAMRSEGYFKQLLSVISSNIAACRRFFDLAFEQPLFPDVVAKIAAYATKSESYEIADTVNILSTGFKAKPEVFRDVLYHIISNQLFAHQQNNTNTTLLASALIVESGAVPKTDIFNLLRNNADTYEQPFQSQSTTHSDKNVLPASTECEIELGGSHNREPNRSDVSVSNEPISHIHGDKKSLPASTECEIELGGSHNRKPNRSDVSVSNEPISHIHGDKKSLPASTECEVELGGSHNREPNRSDVSVSNEPISHIHGDKKSLPASTECEVELGDSHNREPNRSDVSVSNEPISHIHGDKKSLPASTECEVELGDSHNREPNRSDVSVSNEPISHIHGDKKSLPASTECEVELGDSHNREPNRSDVSVSNEPISHIHGDKKSLPASTECEVELGGSHNREPNRSDVSVSNEPISHIHGDKKSLPASTECEVELGDSHNREPNRSDVSVSNEPISHIHGDKKSLPASTECEVELGDSHNREPNRSDVSVSNEPISHIHGDKKSLPASTECEVELGDSHNREPNRSDVSVSNEPISHIHGDKKSLPASTECEVELGGSHNREPNRSDVSVSNEPISHIHGDKKSLPASTECEVDTDTPPSAKDNEMGDRSKSADTSDWHEATQLIALIDKISQSPQIAASDIEQAEEVLSLLMAKTNRLPYKGTSINKSIVNDLKTKSGRLNIGDIIAIGKAIGSTTEEQYRQTNDHRQRLRQKIADAIGKQPRLTERIPLYNAGLVLYNPFLISFFDRLELLENRRQFRSVEHQFRAVHLLQELSGAREEHLEHLLPLNKLLCGVNMLFPVGEKFTPTDRERDEIERLSKALIANWTIIKNSSVAGFQESFVCRRGALERSDRDWILRVETKGIDILLDDIPWNIHIISFPWNDFLIHVDWKL